LGDGGGSTTAASSSVVTFTEGGLFTEAASSSVVTTGSGAGDAADVGADAGECVTAMGCCCVTGGSWMQWDEVLEALVAEAAAELRERWREALV